MKIKNYTPTKGFIWILLLLVFTAWVVYKYVPLTQKKQDQIIKEKIDYQRRKIAEEFDKYTAKDIANLQKFDSRKYFLIKRNGRFWLIPREYYGANGFTIRVIDIDKLIGKSGKVILWWKVGFEFLCIHHNIIIVKLIF
ncbi:hypothetical protein [Acinetobacter baumannii]|uniref:hypothetical protein n=1 Tax=Acinetobacter baumannii TaxID=470 RepID=UPI00209AC1DE|nr:hypothetical protein [Acinetobacter baumannii]